VEEFNDKIQWRKDTGKSLRIDKIWKCKSHIAREYGDTSDEIDMGLYYINRMKYENDLTIWEKKVAILREQMTKKIVPEEKLVTEQLVKNPRKVGKNENQKTTISSGNRNSD
jgi:alpha-glucosidase (family GH31 glycosyl hydrolase)